MAPKRKAADSINDVVLLIGSGDYGQAEVDDSPGFKAVPVRRRRRGVAVLRNHQEVAFTPLPFHPTWLTYSAANDLYYASGDDDKIYALAYDAATMTVSVKGGAPSLGGAAFIEVTQDGKWALVANYGSGVLAVLPLKSDGSIGPASDSKQPWPLEGLDPSLEDRQESCHPHQILLAPTCTVNGKPATQYVLACDLGADKVWIYEFDATRGALIGAINSERHFALPKGYGPRHLAFDPAAVYGMFTVFILCELSGTVETCIWDAGRGVLEHSGHSVSVMPKGLECCRAHHSGCGHIAVKPDSAAGGLCKVYVTSRTDNMIVVLGTPTRPGLEVLQRVSTLGVCPRIFLIDETRGTLTVTNQDTQNAVEYKMGSDGLLEEASARVCEIVGVCPWAMCVAPSN